MTAIDQLIRAGERMHAAIDKVANPTWERPPYDDAQEAFAAQRDWEHYLLRYQTESAQQTTPPATIEALTACRFLTTDDAELRDLLAKLPKSHWARYDLSGVRLGWEARKLMHPCGEGEEDRIKP